MSTNHQLLWFAQETLRDISPNLWDKRVFDQLLVENMRWHIGLNGPDIEKVMAEAIAEEAVANTSRYQQYKKSGGKYVVETNPETGEPLVKAGESQQGDGFVTGGRITGDQIILDTEYGTVNTTTERILTFRLFQQDVLRSCAEVYPSNFKKHHEMHVRAWLPMLSRVEKKEEDDTLPINIIRDYMEEWLSVAETEPIRFEGMIRQKHKAILKDDKEYFFSPDALMKWLKVVDKERKWKKTEIKIYLQTIYGDRFSSEKRLYDARVFAIMRTRTDVPPPVANVYWPNPTAAPDQAQVQHDGGGGKDDATDPGHTRPPETGGEPAGNPGPVVQQGNSGGSQAAPTGEADIPF